MWILWNNNKIQVKRICSSDQMIHVGIYSIQGDLQMWCTTIYAHNSLDKRHKLWEDIEQLSYNINAPWMLMGDYNNVMIVNDRIGGNPVMEKEYIGLVDMMHRVGLFEKESVRDHFTW